MEFKFNIGDKVRVRPYEKLTDEIKNKGLAKAAGKNGEIVDVMYSSAKGCYVYRLQFEDCERASKTDFPEGSLDLVSDLEAATYTYEIEVLENLVVARLYQVEDGKKTEVAKGHGHIFHDGAYGVAQAASYACKRLWFALEEG